MALHTQPELLKPSLVRSQLPRVRRDLPTGNSFLEACPDECIHLFFHRLVAWQIRFFLGHLKRWLLTLPPSVRPEL